MYLAILVVNAHKLYFCIIGPVGNYMNGISIYYVARMAASDGSKWLPYLNPDFS